MSVPNDKNKSVLPKAAVIKSVTAVICVLALSFSGVKICDKVSKNKATIAEIKPEINYTDEAVVDETSADEDEQVIITDDQSQEVTEAESEPESVSDFDDVATESENNSEKTQKPAENFSKAATASKSDYPQTKAEILSYLNDVLNTAKASKPGYSKKYVMKVKGKTDGIPSWLVGIVTKDKNSTMKKGGDCTDDFPAGGYEWSSKLTQNDIESAAIKKSGDIYEITVKLGTERNPAKGTASKYGRIMSVIDANEAKEMVGGALKSINMTYHDGYVIAKINSKSKKLIFAEFSATADISADVALVGSISAQDIVSTETFTNFQY